MYIYDKPRSRYGRQSIRTACPYLFVSQGITYTINTSAFPEWNFDNQQQYGLIAQEVKESVPRIGACHSYGRV
jgi:hypothetical protein